MLKNIVNRDLVREVLNRCRAKEPELFKKVTHKQVLGIINFFTRNICLCMLKNENIYVHKFFSIYSDKATQYRRKRKGFPTAKKKKHRK